MLHKVEIGGFTYKLRYKTWRGGSEFGHCDTSNSSIVIHKTPSKELNRVTLWHELIHATLHSLDLECWHDEQIVDRLAQCIVQILKQGVDKIVDKME